MTADCSGAGSVSDSDSAREGPWKKAAAGATVIVQEKELGKRLQHIKSQLLFMALLLFLLYYVCL